MELTLELNEHKWPDLPRLAEMWDENLDALVTYPSIMVLGGEIASFGPKDVKAFT